MRIIRDLFHFMSYAKGHVWFYVFGFISLGIVNFFDVGAPKLISWAMSSATKRHEPDYEPNWLERMLPDAWFGPDAFMHGMWVYGVAFLAAVCAAGYFRYWMSMTFSRASISISYGLRNSFYNHIQRLPAKWHDKATTGNIMSLATNDMDACRMFWGFGMLLAVDAFFYALYTPMMMLSESVELTLVCALPLPMVPFIVAALAKRIEHRFDKVQDQFSNVSDQASESFSGAKVVKSFAAEAQEVSRFSALSREYKKRALSLARVSTLQNPLLVFMTGSMEFIVVAYGGWLVLKGELEVGQFVAFFFYLLRFAAPMMEIGFVVSMYQRGIVSLRRIEEVMAIKPDIVNAPDARAPEPANGAIELRNLTFGYLPDAAPALSGVSLAIPAGATVAIMGEVGSGKSTLLGLVPRLYDPPAGTVFIDGKDVKDVPLEWLRRHVAAVPQETFLFSDTILGNLGYGLTDGQSDPERLKACARIARVEADILEFPKGYDTMLGERGVNLSGGQKQRVAIARALACQPKILLLDDCLSAVDTETEEAILEGLRNDKPGLRPTTLVVSHRVSSVKHADLIVVLDRGRIAESGTHEHLLAKGGWYADLARKQQLEAELAGM